MKILIKNAKILDMVEKKSNIRKGDILINDNIIEKIDIDINIEVDKIIDAREMIVMPGLINTHTHLAMSIFKGYKDDRKLMDWLENAIFPVEDNLTEEDIYWSSYLACLELIKTGTTTCNDMYFKMHKTIQAIEETGIRANICWSLTDDSIGDKLEKTKEYFKKYNYENSKIKIYVSPHAPYTCNPDTIKLCVDLAKELNTRIHTHLSETVDEENIIKERYGKRSTEYLNDIGIFDVPVVLAHGVHLSDSDIEILKGIKGGISHNPISNCKLSSGICDVIKLRENNINVGLGTDGSGSTTTLDMFEEMKLAAYLQKINTMEPTSINAYNILKMATIEGAKVLGLDNEIGTLEPGKKADMIFVDIDKVHLSPENDICANLVYSANGTDVDTVIIDGKIIMQNRELINIDEKEVMKQVRKIAERLL